MESAEKMRICFVVSGNIPILPEGIRGWGAVEKLMDEYRKSLIALGHHVDIKYLNEVRKEEYDIVHIMVANLCIEAQQNGLPYIYSMHDHSSFHAGKNSFNYTQQLAAIKGSIMSITHAEYVVDYFDDTDKLFFLSHGVNTFYFQPSIPQDGHYLLMVANNGLMGDSGFDRKGFRYGIEAAKRLNLPITVAGADGTREFFKIHTDLLQYDKLQLIDNNPPEDVILNLYRSHTIFVHPSMLEYGEPCLTLLEAASCAIPIVGTYKGSREIKGLHRLHSISTESVVDGIVDVVHNYDKLRADMLMERSSWDWIEVAKKLAKYYKNALICTERYDSERSKELYIKSYNQTTKR